MGYLQKKHPRELYEIMMVLDILADGGVRESKEAYGSSLEEAEAAAAMPGLSRVVNVLESLLTALTDGAYENYVWQEKLGEKMPEDLWVRNHIDDRYAAEMQSVFNQIHKFREGKYYEAKRTGTLPGIETLGKRVRELVIALLYKIEKDDSQD